MFSKAIAAFALALLSSKVSAQTTLSFDILSVDGDLKFFPSNANFPTSVNDGGMPTEGEVTGNRFLQNGNLFEFNSVEINSDESTVGPFDMASPGNFYTSLCTALDGLNLTPPAITQNRCDYNLCTSDGTDEGCIFLVSGGPFDFDPFVQSASSVPEIEASVTGGTGIYIDAKGTATITTLVVPGLDDAGNSLLEITIDLVSPQP
jgi:hypothetical protein